MSEPGKHAKEAVGRIAIEVPTLTEASDAANIFQDSIDAAVAESVADSEARVQQAQEVAMNRAAEVRGLRERVEKAQAENGRLRAIVDVKTPLRLVEQLTARAEKAEAERDALLKNAEEAHFQLGAVEAVFRDAKIPWDYGQTAAVNVKRLIASQMMRRNEIEAERDALKADAREGMIPIEDVKELIACIEHLEVLAHYPEFPHVKVFLAKHGDKLKFKRTEDVMENEIDALKARAEKAERAVGQIRSFAVVLRANHAPTDQAFKIATDIDERLGTP